MDWDENTKRKRLPVYLTGTARSLYRQDIMGQAMDWPAIKDLLKSFFLPVDFYANARHQLHERRHQEGEPVHHFILDIRRLARRVSEDMPFDEIKFRALEGMRKEIKHLLLRRELPDVQTLTHNARLVEDSLSSSKQKEHRKTETEEQKVERKDERKDTLTQVIESLEKRMTRAPAGRRIRSLKNTLCFYCGIAGHSKVNCHLLRHDRSSDSSNESSSAASVCESDSGCEADRIPSLSSYAPTPQDPPFRGFPTTDTKKKTTPHSFSWDDWQPAPELRRQQDSEETGVW